MHLTRHTARWQARHARGVAWQLPRVFLWWLLGMPGDFGSRIYIDNSSMRNEPKNQVRMGRLAETRKGSFSLLYLLVEWNFMASKIDQMLIDAVDPRDSAEYLAGPSICSKF